MTKNKILFFCLLTLGVLESKAQEASTAAGGDASGSGGSVAYSIGQVVYTYESSAAGSINQGVQQPYELLTVGADSYHDISLSMSVYPNPSVSLINLNVGKQDLQGLTFELFDLQGKSLYTQKIIDSLTSINMEEYSAGNYFLKISGSGKEFKTFKIIKN